MLQWVRGPKTAVSTEPIGLDSALASGFNGSAVRRPRLATHVTGTVGATNPLQWVRGPKTAVSFQQITRRPRFAKLQWVRGPKTAVSNENMCLCSPLNLASMGPRSEDRG